MTISWRSCQILPMIICFEVISHDSLENAHGVTHAFHIPYGKVSGKFHTYTKKFLKNSTTKSKYGAVARGSRVLLKSFPRNFELVLVTGNLMTYTCYLCNIQFYFFFLFLLLTCSLSFSVRLIVFDFGEVSSGVFSHPLLKFRCSGKVGINLLSRGNGFSQKYELIRHSSAVLLFFGSYINKLFKNRTPDGVSHGNFCLILLYGWCLKVNFSAYGSNL